MKSSNLLVTTICTFVLALPCAAQDPANDPALAAMQQAEQASRDIQAQAEQSVQEAQRAAEQPALQATANAIDEAVDAGNAGIARSTQGGSGHSHSESRSESSSTTISFGDAAAEPPQDRSQYPAPSRSRWGNGWGRPAVPTPAIPGRWVLGQSNGDSCTISLEPSQWLGGFRANVPAGCPDGFFFVNRWMLVGNDLQLVDSYDKVIGRFQATTLDRWTGRRESDGARLYLNRLN